MKNALGRICPVLVGIVLGFCIVGLIEAVIQERAALRTRVLRLEADVAELQAWAKTSVVIPTMEPIGD